MTRMFKQTKLGFFGLDHGGKLTTGNFSLQTHQVSMGIDVRAK